MAVLDDQAAKYAEMRTRIEHSFVHGEISLLKRLLVAWSGKLPQGIELGADGGLRVALAEPVECWFGLDQDCGRFVHLASRMPGSLTLVVHALGEVGAELLVRVPGPTAKHVHVLGANSPVRLMHPVAIDRCEVGLRIIGRGRIVRISLVFEPGEAASALGRGVDWFAPAAPAAAKAPKKPVTPPRPAAIVPAARAPEPARAAKAEPPKPAKSEPAKPVKAPDTPAPAPAASPVTTTAPPLPRAAAIPAMPAADPQLGEKVKKLAALSLGLKEFSPSLVKIPGLKQAATAAGDIKFGLEKHAYARMPDKFGIAERLQGLAGQIVTLKLDCVVRENANIEVFLGLKTPEQEFQASARPGYANSFRVPEKFESARIALRLAGSGSVEAMKISFEAQPELRVSSRLELRRHLIEVGVQPGKLKIALIADPFTQGNFIGIADIIPVRPNNWRALIAVEKPDLLFVESAWIGNDGAWANRFVNNIDELSDLVAFCRASGIPTVFWNKEDPIHFKRFIKSARLFDLVYTTCAECVPDYLAEGVARADVLPFAVNLATYNPIGGGRVREDWGVFAGSYYGAKYAERSADMDRMLDLTARHGLRIFDRHAGDTSDEFAFPERFRGHIIGSANARQLDAEYKQARIAINVNTVKDSKSMFARRVVELAITGTPTISNFSPALREMFGDALVASDDEAELREEVDRLFTDEAYWQSRRKKLMRLALMNHTMPDRLDQILADLGMPKADPLRNVQIVSLAQEEAGPEWWNRAATIVRLKPEERRRPFATLRGLSHDAEFVAIHVPGGGLSEGLVEELLRHHQYAEADIVGICKSGTPFSYGCKVDPALILAKRSALISSGITLDDLLGGRANDQAGSFGLKVFGVEALSGDDDAAGAGRPVGDALTGWWEAGSNLTVRDDADGIVDVTVKEGPATYLRIGENHPFSRAPTRPVVTAKGEGIALDFQVLRVDSDVRAELHVLFFVGDKRATTKIVTPGVRGFAEGPAGWTSAVLAVRLSGKGQIRFAVGIDRTVQSTSAFVADLVRDLPHDGDNWLCVSAIYPRPDNLYRNAFVHSRIRTYRKAGRNVPVVSLEGNDPIPGSYIFDGALVLVGGKRILREVFAARKFSRILVHNMSRDLMDVLGDTAPDVKKIVWVHAFETESWFRRWCNFELAAPDVSQRILASKKLCDSRTEVLGEVYRRSRADGDCRSIFVSDWFYRNVAIIDTRQTPQDFRIIPNPIDTALFRQRAKQPEDRFKWLSIRPYTARNYANDLTVAAILLLSDEPWFSKAQITLVGRGPLFDSTVAPLRKFSNVKLENTFLRQAEIPGYHARHGLFLCPSRHDSQGVSLGEAMASGMVPISNDRMAIPDFVPREWGVLARHDDPVDLAARIKLLVENPDRFMALAAQASGHIQSICGDEKILQAELKAISDA